MSESPALTPSPPNARIVSLDALSGFDMFWILGMEEVASALAKASPDPWAAFIGHQLDHASWEGFHFLDLIFPLFVFIAGVSSVFSLGRSLAQRGRAATVRKLVVRAVILYALGLFCYNGIANGIENVRWVGVLQRIALSSLAAGLAFLFLKPGARWILFAALLVGYWAAMKWIPVPGFGPGDLAEGRNLANWIDFRFLPGKKWDGTHDPEGLLSSFPAIATALLGVAAGEWLRRDDRTPGKKVLGLLTAGMACATAGWLWHLDFPVVKKLWTSSFVLVAGGYSLLLLGLFYGLVDVLGWRRWTAPFVWIGMNPITLYLSHSIVPYEKIAARLVGGPIAAAFGPWEHVWLAAWVVVLSLTLAWLLHSRRIFLRV